MIVVPVMPSPIDMKAAGDFLVSLRSMGPVIRNKIKVGLVANRARANTNIFLELDTYLVKEKGLLLVEESIAIDFSTPEGGVKFSYSAKNKADYFVENIRVQDGRMVFDMLALDNMKAIVAKKLKKDIELQMPGTHNVSNAVAASVVAYYLGLSCNDVAEGLATFKVQVLIYFKLWMEGR